MLYNALKEIYFLLKHFFFYSTLLTTFLEEIPVLFLNSVHFESIYYVLYI